MQENHLIKLELQSPLVYFRADDLPHVLAENDEFLLCFNLDPVQSRSIEPKPDNLLCSLVFSGKKSDTGVSGADKVSLPAGKYLFTQYRSSTGHLTQEKWSILAVEQQKNGLWERYKPTNRLFVRFLYEDYAFVTQIFRPL
ncbi:MAG: hypothetical protein FWC03_06305 [Treponema sp.]|nr:hypothetical protein [Treponema sp.]